MKPAWFYPTTFRCARSHYWVPPHPGSDLSREFCPLCTCSLSQMTAREHELLYEEQSQVTGAVIPTWYDPVTTLHHWQPERPRCDECGRSWWWHKRYCKRCGLSYNAHVDKQHKTRAIVRRIAKRKRLRT